MVYLYIAKQKVKNHECSFSIYAVQYYGVNVFRNAAVSWWNLLCIHNTVNEWNESYFFVMCSCSAIVYWYFYLVEYFYLSSCIFCSQFSVVLLYFWTWNFDSWQCQFSGKHINKRLSGLSCPKNSVSALVVWF